MVPRRAQAPVSIRSDKAAARLALLTQNGRSQAKIIEDALELMPLPKVSVEEEARRADLRKLFRQLNQRVPPIPSMAEFDAAEYDENGNPR
jgi:hypothetical protein